MVNVQDYWFAFDVDYTYVISKCINKVNVYKINRQTEKVNKLLMEKYTWEAIGNEMYHFFEDIMSDEKGAGQ